MNWPTFLTALVALAILIILPRLPAALVAVGGELGRRSGAATEKIAPSDKAEA